MCAAAPALRCVVHRGVHVQFFNCFWRWARQSLPDRAIYRGAGHDFTAQIVEIVSGLPNIYRDPAGANLTCGFAVKDIVCRYSIEQEGVACVALTVAPNGLVANTRVRT